MNKSIKASIYSAVLICLLLGLSISSPAAASSSLYVKVGGSDANDCLSPSTACATINAALGKAAEGDTILVTADKYYGYGGDVVYITKDIVLSGGWDQAFTTRTGFSVVDGSDRWIVLETLQGTHVSVEYFVLQNGYSTSTASGISNYGNLSLYNSIVQDNFGTDSTGAGIANYGSLTVINSTIQRNFGQGIYNWQNATGLSINGSTISENTNGVGIWIYGQSASIVNSTISNNVNPGYSSDGGGIFFGGEAGDVLTLRNVTISGNTTANNGGGIASNGQNGEQVVMANSIISGNLATYGHDCSGPITSQGNNIIADSRDCALNDAPGDQLDVNPLLAGLSYNGGPTATHRLLAGSPAIDGGNPAGCPDAAGNVLTIDQRGFTRPLDGNGDGIPVCDVGAYEYDPTLILRGLYLPVIRK
jgi:hypothetical protein